MLRYKNVAGAQNFVPLLTLAAIFLFTSCAAITGYASSNAPNPQIGKIKYVPGEILVKFRSGVSQAGIKAFNRSQHTQVLQEVPGIRVLRLKLPLGRDVIRAAEEYGKNPDVEYAEPNYIYHPYASPNDDMYSKQWALEKINMESAGVSIADIVINTVNPAISLAEVKGLSKDIGNDVWDIIEKPVAK